jgi:hypothetical protein
MHGRVRDSLGLQGLGHLGRVLVVPDNELNLRAVDTTGLVEILDGQLDRPQRASPDRRLIPSKRSLGSDLDLIGLVRRGCVTTTSAARCQPHTGHGDEDENLWLCHPSCRPPLPSLKT